MKKCILFLVTLFIMLFPVSIPCYANAADLPGVSSDQELTGGTDKDRDAGFEYVMNCLYVYKNIKGREWFEKEVIGLNCICTLPDTLRVQYNI